MRNLHLVNRPNAVLSNATSRSNQLQPSFKNSLTDLGNSERLVDCFGKEIRFCKAKGWLVYDDCRWTRDDKNKVIQLAKRTARKILWETENLSDPDLRSRLATHALRSQSRRAIEAMVALAQSDPKIAIQASDLDSDPWLLNVLNGTLNLRTGELQKHRRSDLITKLAPVQYNAYASCPLWLRFLERVQPEPEVRSFLQRFAGYALTGVIREHVMPTNYGPGRNGKGVFANTLLHVMGAYAKQIPTELLTVKHGDAHPTDRATLLGCRFAAAVETEQERALNVALVKQLTGGDRISARFMRQDFFEFEPTHKLMLSTNHRPVIKETKNAIWDRVLLIPWPTVIPEAEQDKELPDKLKTEAPGILSWAVDGCLAWQKQGLNPPAAIRAATSDYREEQDFLASFLEECCIVESDAKARGSDLFRAYRAWAERNGETIQSQIAFAERLGENGFAKSKSNGLKIYRGLKLDTGLRDTRDSLSLLRPTLESMN